MPSTTVTPTRRLSGKRKTAYWALAIIVIICGYFIIWPDRSEAIGYQLVGLALGLVVLLWATGGPPHRLAEKRVSIISIRRMREGIRQLFLPLMAILFIAFVVLLFSALVWGSTKRFIWAGVRINRSVANTLRGLAIIFLLSGTGLCLILARRLLRRPLLLAHDGGNLIVYSLFGQHVLHGAGLQVRCLLPAVGDGPVQGFVFETDPLYGRPLTVAYGAGPWRRRAVFEPLYAWLGEHNIPVIDTRAVIVPSRLRQLGAAVGEGLVGLAGFIATSSITLIVIYWLTWLKCGTLVLYENYWYVAFSVSLLLGFFFLVSPVRSWLWILFGAIRGFIIKPDQAPGAIPLHLAEAWSPPARWASTTRRGWLRIEDDALTLGMGQKELTIRRGQIQSLSQCGWRHRWLSLTVPRQISRPVELVWLDEQYEEHALLLIARGGRSFGYERRLERQLHTVLQDWLCQVEPPNATNCKGLSWYRPVVCRPRLAPVLGSLFLLIGLAGPFLHNYLVMTRIRTGRWFPPTNIRPTHRLLPFIYSVAALEPGPIFFRSTQNRGNSPYPYYVWDGVWYGDPFRGPFRPLGFGLDEPYLSSIPGDRSHYLSDGGHNLETVLFPSLYLLLPLRLDRRSADYFKHFPSQVVSADSGQIIELPRHYQSFTTALFRDQRLFSSDYRNDYYEIFWLDLKNMKSHPMGRIPFKSFEDDSQHDIPIFNSPAYFPDGWHVLFKGHVINLETGEQMRIDWSHITSILKDSNVEFLGNQFKMSNRLRFLVSDVRQLNEETKINLEAVWEIDPGSARVELVERLPPDARLISADGDRWLIKTPTPENKQHCVLSLYNHTTGRSRELRREPTYFNPDPITVLLAGQPRYARWTEEDGWKVFETGELLGTAR